MPSDDFLDNSEFEISKFNINKDSVKYYKSKSTIFPIGKKVQIYDDDTVKEVLIKLAVASKQNVRSDHIFAWIEKSGKLIPLGFEYKDVTMDYPYKNKEIDPKFVDKDGNRKMISLDSTIHKIMEWFELSNFTIKFTTLYDYIKHLGFDPTKEITDEVCSKKTGFTCSQLFNGKIWKYWPRINDINEFLYFSNPSLVKQRIQRIKSERSIYERNVSQLNLIHKTREPIYAEDYNTCMFSVSNFQDNNNIHLFKLFSDIILGDNGSSLIPFSKITLENYEQTYSKLSKDVISYTGVDPKRFVSKELFMKWYRNQVISIPNSPVKFMDNTNTVTFKLYKDTHYVTMIIYSDGLVKVLFNDLTNDVFKKSFIRKMIGLSNEFIDYLNKKGTYSNDKIKRLDEDYKKSFDVIVSNFVYPVKHYKIELVITLLENLSSFIRFNKTQDTMISCIYKRISDYDTTDIILRTITSLHSSKRKLKSDQIIEEIGKIFNLSEEDAEDEYEQWEHLSNGGKIFQQGEAGIEFIIDLLGTNIKVDLSSVNSYSEFTRIYKFINCVMKYYNDYIESKKDPHNLFKKNAKLLDQYNSADESVDDTDLELMIDAANLIEDKMKEGAEEDPDESVLSDRESKEEQIHSIVSADESESELRLSNMSEDEDSDILEELGKMDSESDGGGNHKQKGGYNVYRYYLSRLNRYDKGLFSGDNKRPYSVKQHKSQKQGTQKYTYAGKCGAVIGRQPVAVTEAELEKINATDEGHGVSFHESVNIAGRDPKIYYMCPKYWDVKEDRPRDPKRVDEFRKHIVDNKASTHQKKTSDNYILRRDEGGYWDEAGDDITRYRIELWDNFHPKGFKVPCCHAPREGYDTYEKGWKVDVLVDVKGKSDWRLGTVVSSTKKKVKVNQGGSIKTFDKNSGKVRRHKDSKYITSSFPCNLGSYGHVNPIIKQLIHQDITHPLQSSVDNIGLIRKGIKRGSDIGDHSLLDSLQEILSDNNSSVNALKEHIIDDLESPQMDVFSIGGGAFVNKFKLNFEDFEDVKDVKDNSELLEDLWFSIGKDLGMARKYKGKLKGLPRNEKLLKLIDDCDVDDLPLIHRAINKYSSILQFGKYLRDDNEILLDQYIIPVLVSISKHTSSTFGKPIHDLSIVVFEGNNEDVIISPPIGGFPTKSTSMILLYKERGHLYEPILYRRFDNHVGLITEYGTEFDDQNEQMNIILNAIQRIINKYNDDNPSSDLLMNLSKLTNLMNSLGLPITNHVYDNYNKIIHVITDKDVLIPVIPSNIGNLDKCIYYPELPASNYPRYQDVIDILELIDRKSTSKEFRKYLTNAGLSVVEKSKGSLNLEINEIILESGHYIPVAHEEYDRSKHKLDVISINSYRDIDNSLCIHSHSTDARYKFSLENDYKKNITELFFQKVYLMIKWDKPLSEKLREIKHHDIKLRCHKAEEIYKILNPKVTKLIKVKDDPYNPLSYEEKDTLVIRNINDELTGDIIYQKILKLFIQLYIIYAEQDFDRFLQLDCSLTKINQLLGNNEILLTYSDIRNESYLEHFVRYSQHIRNVSLYGEGITKSKLSQLLDQKDKSRKEVKFVKQYPQIIRTLFGRDLSLVKSSSDLELLSKCLLVEPGQEINTEIIKVLLGVGNDYKLVSNDLDLLSEKYKIGFCLVTQLHTKLLKHDIIIKIHDETKKKYREAEDTIPIILLYQSEDNLIHIIRKGDVSPELKDLTSDLFKKHAKDI